MGLFDLTCAEACYAHNLASARAGAASITAHTEWPCASLADQALALSLCASNLSQVSVEDIYSQMLSRKASDRETDDGHKRLPHRLCSMGFCTGG